MIKVQRVHAVMCAARIVAYLNTTRRMQAWRRSLSLFSFQFCVKRKRLSIITLEWRFHGQKLI